MCEYSPIIPRLPAEGTLLRLNVPPAWRDFQQQLYKEPLTQPGPWEAECADAFRFNRFLLSLPLMRDPIGPPMSRPGLRGVPPAHRPCLESKNILAFWRSVCYVLVKEEVLNWLGYPGADRSRGYGKISNGRSSAGRPWRLWYWDSSDSPGISSYLVKGALLRTSPTSPSNFSFWSPARSRDLFPGNWTWPGFSPHSSPPPRP
jgi:hypothetical protein